VVDADGTAGHHRDGRHAGRQLGGGAGRRDRGHDLLAYATTARLATDHVLMTRE
jgi:hypothetical protein